MDKTVMILPKDNIRLVIWIDEKFFIEAEILGADLEKSLSTAMTEGINRIQYENRYIFYPSHRISKIEVIVEDEPTEDT